MGRTILGRLRVPLAAPTGHEAGIADASCQDCCHLCSVGLVPGSWPRTPDSTLGRPGHAASSGGPSPEANHLGHSEPKGSKCTSVQGSPRPNTGLRLPHPWPRVKIDVLHVMSSMPWGDRAGWRKVSRLESSTWIRWPLICHFSLSDTPPNPLGDRLAQHLTVTIEQVDPPCPNSHTG